MIDKELVIFIGLQGSGKSTFFQASFAREHFTHVSKDLLRNNRNPERRQREMIEQALSLGQSVVVDNTNPRRSDRAPLIALGRAAGVPVIGYYFPPDVRASLMRNARRLGRAQVPEVAIHVTARRLEHPSLDEGFDALYEVEVAGEGTFLVKPLAFRQAPASERGAPPPHPG